MKLVRVNCGYVAKEDGSCKTPIIASATMPNKLVDILIGGVLVGVGIFHMTRTAFKQGVHAYEAGEMKAFDEAQLLGHENNVINDTIREL